MAPWWLRTHTDEENFEDVPPEDDTPQDVASPPPAPAPREERAEKRAAPEPRAAEPEVTAAPKQESPPPTAAEDEAVTDRPAASDVANDDEAAARRNGDDGDERRRRRRRRRGGETRPGARPATAEVRASGDGDAAAAAAAASDDDRHRRGYEGPLREVVFSVPEVMTASGERRIAMLCDLENIALGVRDSEIKKLDINLILKRLLEKGKLMVKKAYADWERYSDYKRPFHEAAIELIDIPQKFYSGKNSADIKMVVDAMDLCYSKEHLDTFAIVSGDSDFSPLVSKLKENNKFVIGIGVKNSSSNLLVDNCDEFIYYEDVWRVAQRGPRLGHLTPKDAEVFGLMSDAMLALIRENKDVLWGSMLKQTMQRKRPSFNESYYGYGSFSELLEDAERKGIIALSRDERSGSYIVTGFAQRG